MWNPTHGWVTYEQEEWQINITDGSCKVSNGRCLTTLIFYVWPSQNWAHTPAKKNDKVYPTFIKVGPKVGPQGRFQRWASMATVSYNVVHLRFVFTS